MGNLRGHRFAMIGLFVSALAMIAAATGADGDKKQTSADRQLQPEDLRALSWRSIGPANMGGRIADIALAPGNPKTIFLGYATGGVWKSTNNGTTFSPIFDKYETGSIGAIAVADVPPDWPGWKDEDLEDDADLEKLGKARIIWVGTGEGNGRNSSSWGNGVYRSTDGGASFEHVGLADSHDITELVLDPRDPDVCYVAAMGHLWGSNTMRGVYKTANGGKTWNAILQVDDTTGAIEVMLDPENPDTVYAAMYTRQRTPWGFEGLSDHGGIFKSTNAGKSWKKLTNGLPTVTGRIGLDVYDSNPNILMAVIESDEGGRIGDPFVNRSRAGGVYRSENGGESWFRTSDMAPRSFYFSRIRIDPDDDQRVYLPAWTLLISDDGSKTFRNGAANVVHVDYHAMVIDPNDTDHLLVGTDGGLYVSWDRGKTWDFHNHMAVGQFYNVAVDNADPYRVGGGLQDNGSWIGPSETIFEDKGDFMGRSGSITNKDWKFIWWGDGFHVAFDPNDPNLVYAESQGGYIGRVHLDTGQWRMLKPAEREGEPKFRFNWNAPFFISPHDDTTLYLGGNHVFKLTEQGDRWERISPDLTRNEIDKVRSMGSEAETYGTVVSLAESPLAAGLIWAGSDDGLIHLTTDDGKKWKDVSPKSLKPDGKGYVSKIEPSRFNKKTAYVAIDGHRGNAFKPVLLMTTNAGKSWKSIAGDLPEDPAEGGAPVKVIREDPRNADVLYAGTEHASYVTIDRGKHWVKLNGKSLPTVAVDDLAIQAREMDLVAGTHGRSIWILDDISPLSQMTPDVLNSEFHVFEPMPAKPRYLRPYGALWSDRMFVANNPPMGAVISYWIRDYSGEEIKIAIADGNGHVLRKLDGKNQQGLNRVVWDLQAEPKQRLGNPHELPEFVPAGEYTVTITNGEASEKITLTVLLAPGHKAD